MSKVHYLRDTILKKPVHSKPRFLFISVPLSFPSIFEESKLEIIGGTARKSRGGSGWTKHSHNHGETGHFDAENGRITLRNHFKREVAPKRKRDDSAKGKGCGGRGAREGIVKGEMKAKGTWREK